MILADSSRTSLRKEVVIVVVVVVVAVVVIEKNEMGDAWGAYGGGERCAQCSGGEA